MILAQFRRRGGDAPRPRISSFKNPRSLPNADCGAAAVPSLSQFADQQARGALHPVHGLHVPDREEGHRPDRAQERRVHPHRGVGAPQHLPVCPPGNRKCTCRLLDYMRTLRPLAMPSEGSRLSRACDSTDPAVPAVVGPVESLGEGARPSLLCCLACLPSHAGQTRSSPGSVPRVADVSLCASRSASNNHCHCCKH